MSTTENETVLPGWVQNANTPRGLYAGILILFCFPFVEISCHEGKNGPENIHSRSGLQMALGGHTTTTVSAAGSVTRSRSTLSGESGNPWMTVFAIAVVAGLTISIVAATRKDWKIAEAVCASLALTALLFQFVLLDTYRSKLGDNSMAEFGSISGRYTVWLYLTFLSSIGSVALAVIRIRRLTEKEAEPDSSDPLQDAASP